MTEFIYTNGDDAYLGLRDAILSRGATVSPRGFETRELRHVTVVIENPMQAVPLNVGRKVKYAIGATETVHLIGGVSSLEQLNAASNGRFSQFANEGKLIGAYGPRTYYQLPSIVGLLAGEHDTRQAIVTVFKDDDAAVSNDVPCTLSMEFHVRDGHLEMAVHMRSNDLWLGVPYDWWMFTRLQMTIAWAMGLPLGRYVHHVDSFHIYARDIESIVALKHDGENRDQPPGIVTPNLVPASKERAVTKFRDATRIARAICLPYMYVKARKYMGSFLEPVQWYSNHVPELGPDFWLCELATPGGYKACRYIQPSKSFENSRRCCECNGLRDEHLFQTQGGSINQRKFLRFLCAGKTFGELVADQEGRCAICNTAPKNGLVIDHDHSTLEFRALLCTQCNSGLGLFQENPAALRAAADYIERFETASQQERVDEA
jgi:thymidylate synthase